MTTLPPLEPSFPQPPDVDNITNGIYIIGWRLHKNLKETLSGSEPFALSPAVEVASVSEVPSTEGASAPVTVKPIIDGIQPAGQYWHVKRKIDSSGSFVIRPFKAATNITAFNQNDKLVAQNIAFPPEWTISRLSPEVPVYIIAEVGSGRVWSYPKDGGQVVLEEKGKKLNHLLYMIKIADDTNIV